MSSAYNYDDLTEGDDSFNASALIASIFSDAADVASTAIQTNNQPQINPALYNYGSGNVVAGAGLMFPHTSGSGLPLLAIAGIGLVAYLLLRKK